MQTNLETIQACAAEDKVGQILTASELHLQLSFMPISQILSPPSWMALGTCTQGIHRARGKSSSEESRQTPPWTAQSQRNPERDPGTVFSLHPPYPRPISISAGRAHKALSIYLSLF